MRLKYALLILSFGLIHNQIGIDGYFKVTTKNIWIFLSFLQKVNSFTIIIIPLQARHLTYHEQDQTDFEACMDLTILRPFALITFSG